MLDTGKTVSVLGKTYPVLLTDGSKFRVDLGDGQDLEAATYSELVTMARDFKDVRFDLPFTTDTGRNGSVTGFHAGNGNLLIRWGDGTTEQRYGVQDAMPQLSGTDLEIFARLLKAKHAAYLAVQQFVQTHKFPDGTKEAALKARAEKAGLS